MSRIAVKTLTGSDLTLFEWHFRNKNAGNQKSINLNANIFIDELYPYLSNTDVGGARVGFQSTFTSTGLGRAGLQPPAEDHQRRHV